MARMSTPAPGAHFYYNCANQIINAGTHYEGNAPALPIPAGGSWFGIHDGSTNQKPWFVKASFDVGSGATWTQTPASAMHTAGAQLGYPQEVIDATLGGSL